MLAQSVNRVTLDKARSPTKSEWDSANAKLYKHTDDCSMKSEGDSAENQIDGVDGEQSLW